MMIVVVLALWCISAILLFTSPGRESNRWASLLAFVGSFGFLAAVINESIRPYLQAHGLSTLELDNNLLLGANLSSFICQTGLPYVFLQYACSMTPFFTLKAKRLISLFSFLPVILMYVVTPVHPILGFNYILFTIWAAPYIIGASFLLSYSFWKEKDPVMKRTRLLSNILTIIPLVYLLFSIYIARVLGFHDAWRTNQLIILLQFIAFIAFCLKYGVLGVKLRFENYRLDSTIRAISSGSTILNHTIKNEIGKIRMFTIRIQQYASEENKEKMEEDIQILLQSTEHMLNMVNRIQDHAQAIVLKKEPIAVHKILHQTLQKLGPYLESHKMEINLQLTDDMTLHCDPVHIQEVLTNLMMNATEAVKSSGILNIYQFDSKKHVIIAIEDNGPGISKENLPYVLDPFFSTKKQNTNFGLGLSYCYNVMKQHGGALEIQSELGAGTTVYLYFSKKKIHQT
ncbi:sensor histidine kinase [Caldalkalibacillus mannanilyticus]|uniref:sensor histidine kinase n=1 Tax=Caldalkalibacillus mannanilyticus TaxID=1418 RepID=UPI000468B5C7|nr:HAMP domain-containing sensor histidine kinase [Caldalkalibacillus mannanilyticus]